MQFRYFKDAWRNHVCHLREKYNHDQALTILMQVKDFMGASVFALERNVDRLIRHVESKSILGVW